jgi:hypothetical protein
VARPSHMIQTNIITDTKDRIDPREEITFHVVNASG